MLLTECLFTVKRFHILHHYHSTCIQECFTLYICIRILLYTDMHRGPTGQQAKNMLHTFYMYRERERGKERERERERWHSDKCPALVHLDLSTPRSKCTSISVLVHRNLRSYDIEAVGVSHLATTSVTSRGRLGASW
jgi:hypothetical protein